MRQQYKKCIIIFVFPLRFRATLHLIILILLYAVSVFHNLHAKEFIIVFVAPLFQLRAVIRLRGAASYRLKERSNVLIAAITV